MSKISPYQLASISVELEQFRDDVTNVLNLGKYASSITTTAPNWSATKGETNWVMPSSGGTTLYVYRNTAWVALISVTV